ncbi:hypothetical protein CDAR_541541 [Caerostris darwini]|uniref:Uncharacterized protein n=1 Tax=Caerostris darwini TaxID=1538125 RepID=A0AAV4UUI6_9ARAC|nr:hypothetical protein CDAR_541541 [Caerostris darwini]
MAMEGIKIPDESMSNQPLRLFFTADGMEQPCKRFGGAQTFHVAVAAADKPRNIEETEWYTRNAGHVMLSLCTDRRMA